MKNILVPKHEVLDDKNSEKLLEVYKLTRDELPKISESDPALKGLGAKVGNVIKITRESPSAGTALYYRVVIEG